MRDKKHHLITTVALGLAFGLTTPTGAEAASNYKDLWEDEAKGNTLEPTTVDTTVINGAVGTYKNTQLGYQFAFPSEWSIDNHIASESTRFYGTDFRVDVTHDNLKTRMINLDGYVQKTIASLTNEVTNQKVWQTQSGLEVYEVSYTRPLISGIANDLNQYTYYFVSNGEKLEIIQLKTDVASNSIMQGKVTELIHSMTFFNGAHEPLNAEFSPSSEGVAIHYKEEEKEFTIGKGEVAMGLYVTGNAGNIKNNETELNTHFGSQMFYKAINSNYDSHVGDMLDDGKMPLVTFHFDDSQLTDDSEVVRKVINGDYDSNIASWAQGMKNTKSPVFVRIANEMNGEWVYWSHKYNYNDADLYKLAYRHVVDIFKANQADNVKFVWNPNNASNPKLSWNDEHMYYPGDNYVDWIGMTAYNFGKTEWSDYKYFDDLYEDMYRKYSRMFPGKPMLIGEFASVEETGNKPYFIQDMYKKITEDYPNLKLVIWFNTEEGLPYDTSDASKEAFKQGLQNEDIIEHPITNNIPEGLIVSKPNNTTTNQSLWTFTGVAVDKEITGVSINGKAQTFRWSSWRQFDQKVALHDGENEIVIHLAYKDGSTKEINYYIHKKSSFKFSTSVGTEISNAVETKRNFVTLTGLVLDKNIATMRVNGGGYDIRYSWRQFDVPVDIGSGLNEYTVTGYNANGKEVAKETFYLFKDGQLNITSHKSQNFKVNTLGTTITGMDKYHDFSSIKIDGIEQQLKWSWRQFDQALKLNYGLNPFDVDTIYYGSLKGVPYHYPMHREYVAEAPSYDYLSDVSSNRYAPIKVEGNEVEIEGIVKNKDIGALVINGNPVDLLYDWNQFVYDAVLQNGLNVVNIVSYTDDTHQTKVSEDKVYFYTEGVDLSNEFKITSHPAYSFTLQDETTISGLVSNKNINELYVNGERQELKWSWKQFDAKVKLDKGVNTFRVDAIYSYVINGKTFKETISKTIDIHTPSFDFSVPASYQKEWPTAAYKSQQWIGGFVKDDKIKSMKINGKEVPIRYSWRQFDYTANLQMGMNRFVIQTYEEANYQNELAEEVIYLYRHR